MLSPDITHTSPSLSFSTGSAARSGVASVSSDVAARRERREQGICMGAAEEKANRGNVEHRERKGINAQHPTPNAQLPKQAAFRVRVLPLGVGN